jgi:hypothetical protein
MTPLESLDRAGAEADRLLAADPAMSGVTAFVMASDRVQAQEYEARIRDGRTPPERGVQLVGSYARCDLAVRLHADGLLSEEWLLREWPDLWRGSDPDDTDPRFLAVWRRVRAARGRIVTDGLRLPAGKVLPVYRGQPVDARYGIAWTLDRKIAEQFAVTGGGRGPRLDQGTVLRAWAPRRKVLAFITLRNESEIVIDPMDLT